MFVFNSWPKNNTPFTKNRREIVTIQKNDRLGFISFEKAFSSYTIYLTYDGSIEKVKK
jgi:hypothetical protein